MERGPCSFHIVVPATHPRDHAYTEGESRALARERLDRALTRLRAAGATVDGEVGDEHPIYAVQEVLDREMFDAIIVSTLPHTISRWLRTDLMHRVQGFGVPVIHVVGSRSRPVAAP
jgi:hypothetical protein